MEGVKVVLPKSSCLCFGKDLVCVVTHFHSALENDSLFKLGGHCATLSHADTEMFAVSLLFALPRVPHRTALRPIAPELQQEDSFKFCVNIAIETISPP